MNFKSETERLVKEVTALMKLDEFEQFDLFAERIDRYLEDLSLWKTAFENDNPLAPGSGVEEDVRTALRNTVERLQDIHGQLMAKVERLRNDVGGQISDLHKRSKALRTYTDPFPRRITITGKRTG